MNFERRSETHRHVDRPAVNGPDHAPAARTMTGASTAPAVVTLDPRAAPAPVTTVPVRISTPGSQARATIAVMTRYGSACHRAGIGCPEQVLVSR
jgi:hypothetical protein